MLGFAIKALKRLLPTAGLGVLAFGLAGCLNPKTQDFWDGAKEICIATLTSKKPVQDAAAARKMTGLGWATALCEIPSIIGEFVVERDPEVAGDKALNVARARGLQ
jgi:hypothetical protein